MLNKIFKIAAGALLLFLFIFLFSFGFRKQPGEERIPKTKHGAERGLYITFYMAQTKSRFETIRRQAKECGLNTLVVDAKELLSRPLVELARQKKLSADTKVTPEAWFSQLNNKLHEEGFIVSARLVTFKDDHLVIARPDLGVRVKGGGLYLDRKGGKWADPYAEEVRLYNELIAERAALSGFDEVQFDYIRFPAEGRAHDAYYPFEKAGISKVEAISSFLESVKKRLQKYNVSIAVDIFGITAWQSKNDIKNLGQDLKQMAKQIDVLAPMLYPSHFHRGYDGFDNPGAYPYYFINTGIKKMKEILSDEAVSIVPWIQGFNMRSPNFGPNYISEQVKGAKDAGVQNYLIWNAGNVYDTSFRALKK